MEWTGEWIGVNPGDCNGELVGGTTMAGETAKGSSSSKSGGGELREGVTGPMEESSERGEVVPE